MPRFEDFKDFYTKHLNAMVITREAAVEEAAHKIIALRGRYENVQKLTLVPWYFTGALHMRECDNNMRGCLHNGQLIIGTGRRTTMVPRGRGPFATFEDSGVDAYRIEGIVGIPDWSLERMCFLAEEFNGEGYHSRGLPSPYVFAGSNQYSHGKFYDDGKYSPTMIDDQLGVAPVMKRVLELTAADHDEIVIADKAPEGHFIIPAADPPKDEPRILTSSEKKEVVDNSTHLTMMGRYQNFLEASGAIGAAAVSVLGQVKSVLYDPMTWIVVALGVTTWLVLERAKVKAFAQVVEGRYLPSGLAKLLGVVPSAPGGVFVVASTTSETSVASTTSETSTVEVVGPALPAAQAETPAPAPAAVKAATA